jgi:hypothetical protein
MKKLAASSLLEVLIAGVLLCIAVSISFVTFVNVTSSAPSFRQHQLDVFLHDRINAIRKEALVVWERKDTVAGGSTLIETVTQFSNNKNLFMINVEVTGTDGKIEARASALSYQYDEQVP